MSKTHFQPSRYGTITPYLTVKDASAALEFYQELLGAEKLRCFEHEGKIGHAELKVGDSMIMLSDEWVEHGIRGPKTLGGTPVGFHVYVPDVDEIAKKAEALGCKILQPLKDQFYGDRSCKIEDPYGHHWSLATQTEEISEDELQRRAQGAF